MSTRIGMADGRCITDFTASKILHEELMKNNSINIYDNYKFRTTFQQNGPDSLNLPLRNGACMTSQASVLVSQSDGSC